MTPEIVPATPELLERFYGRKPRHTVLALAAVLDGEPLCIGGVHCDGARLVAFASIRPVMRERYRKTGMRMARKVMATCARRGVRVFALADEHVEASERFLERLGFRQHKGSVYVWEP